MGFSFLINRFKGNSSVLLYCRRHHVCHDSKTFVFLFKWRDCKWPDRVVPFITVRNVLKAKPYISEYSFSCHFVWRHIALFQLIACLFLWLILYHPCLCVFFKICMTEMGNSKTVCLLFPGKKLCNSVKIFVFYGGFYT